MKDEHAAVEQVIRAVDNAWSQNDLEGMVALFAQDATLESPLVPRLLNRKEGVCRGRDEIRDVIRGLMLRGRPWGGHEPPIIQGNRVAIEFRRPSSEGEQLYSVDVIEIVDGRIQSLRAYTGWRAVAAQSGEGRG